MYYFLITVLHFTIIYASRVFRAIVLICVWWKYCLMVATLPSSTLTHIRLDWNWLWWPCLPQERHKGYRSGVTSSPEGHLTAGEDKTTKIKVSPPSWVESWGENPAGGRYRRPDPTWTCSHLEELGLDTSRKFRRGDHPHRSGERHLLGEWPN